MEGDYKKESDCSVARARYLPLQIWYLTSPRLSAALPISTPSSTSPPSLSPRSSFHQMLYSHQLIFPFARLFFPPADQTQVSHLRSSGILSLYMSIIHIFLHLFKNKHKNYASYMHILTHCLYQWFPSVVCFCFLLSLVAYIVIFFLMFELFLKRSGTAKLLQ